MEDIKIGTILQLKEDARWGKKGDKFEVVENETETNNCVYARRVDGTVIKNYFEDIVESTYIDIRRFDLSKL